MLKENMLKSSITITTAVTAFLIMICIFAGSSAYAANGLIVKPGKIDMDKDNDTEYCIDLDKSSEEYIEDVEIINEGVVEIYGIKDDGFMLFPVGMGDAIVRITGSEGSVVDVPVHLGEKEFRYLIKQETNVLGFDYGAREAEVYTNQNAKVSMKIGKDKYSAKDTGVKGVAKFKLKKMYDVRTKVRITVKKEGVAYTFTEKFENNSSVGRIKAKGKVFTATVYDVHKGDVVEVKYAGKTYKKKIKKNYSHKDVKIKTRVKKIKKNAKIKVTLKNKYKSTLMKYNLKLKNGEALTYIEW